MKQIFVADSQILNEVMSCARKAHFTFDKNLIPVFKPSYFETGDLIHVMLAEYFRLRMYRTRWITNNTSHADIVGICVKVGMNHAVKLSLAPTEIDDVVRTFQEYTAHIANNGWDNIKAVEEVGVKTLYEDENLVILYQFKIDLIISLQNCAILPIDHKSSKQRRDPNKLSNQFMGYCWGLGVNNIIENKIGFQKTLKPEEKFNEHTLSYSQDALEEWREIAIYWLLKYFHDSGSNFYPANFTSCDKYAGCIFRDVCTSSKEVREMKLLQMFETRPDKWDVGKAGL